MPAIIRVTAESNNATESVNVWHFQIPNSAPITEANAAVAALDAFYTTINAVLAPDTWTIGQRVVTVDQSPNLLIGATTQTASGGGAARAPQQVCIVGTLGSSVIGGSRRGRVYLGPLAVAALDTTGRGPTSSAITTVSGALATLMAASGSGIDLVVWSRKLLAATIVTSVTVNPVLGTQRRRLT